MAEASPPLAVGVDDADALAVGEGDPSLGGRPGAYGTYLRRAGRTAAARSTLGEAAQAAEQAGATALADLASTELRAAGGRRRRRRAGGQQLTAAEERVLARVVAGAKNRQIAEELYVSEATVKTHVARIFAKLGVHSRRDLIGLNPHRPYTSPVHRPGESEAQRGGTAFAPDVPVSVVPMAAPALGTATAQVRR